MTNATADPNVTVQKVVVVDGGAEALSILEPVLDAGRYDMVFVESIGHAYSHIKEIAPNLVILCAGLDQPGGFQLLTMLKLDEDTRNIPVLTYTTESAEPEFDGPARRRDADDELEQMRSLSMN